MIILITTIVRAAILNAALAFIGFSGISIEGRILPQTAYYQTPTVQISNLARLTENEFVQLSIPLARRIANRRIVPITSMIHAGVYAQILEEAVRRCGGFTKDRVHAWPMLEALDIKAEMIKNGC